LIAASCKGEYDVVKCLLSSGADINLCDEDGCSPLSVASWKGEYDTELSKHLTTSHSPIIDALNNGDCPSLSHKLISAPELSKCLTTSDSPLDDAANNGECPSSLRKC
jgi:ankyrin repeat protein